MCAAVGAARLSRAGRVARVHAAMTRTQAAFVNVPPPVLARQPIFDRSRRLIGHELLYRGGWEDGVSGSTATARVMMEALSQIDSDALAGDGLLFVNMPREALDWSLEQWLPPDRFVLEILEDVSPDDSAVSAVRRQRSAGFRIALDDFDGTDAHSLLVAEADFVKMDVLALGIRAASVKDRFHA